MPPSPSIRTENLTIRFGGHAAVSSVTCAFHPGELTVIVGPNGAGKTTWFNLVSGQLRPSAGRIFLGERDITRLSPSERAKAGIGRAFQLTNLFPKLSVLENVRLAVQAKAGRGSQLFTRTTRLTGLTDKAMQHLIETNLTSVADLPAAALPHGDQRKLEVALLLAMEPDIFMFDEPTAGMSVDEAPVILDLIARIKQDRSRTVLLVEHKMDVVRALADRIVVLHNGELVADGAPGEVMALALVREIYLGIGAEEVA
ncbi:MAG: ABC transporter ATP-binding protein [Alphaproteobacteria bacterium]|nr:ABC transporter ATP-binding protein [Alphaproteobacteria bacterium]MBU1561647.1 ABC transporter ATP-binding protein [Alphaproteobacteria bacterium]MBU2302372.1 ABC transporter ATP-binding protein [Alphaproteobacteria bacterium]MBU2368652.1 ABC transporter ATP-binding protein [Alphaproteobacteria bacterium]